MEVRRSAPTSGLDSASDASHPDAPHMWTRSDPLGPPGGPLRAGKMLWELLLFVLLADVRATYHLSPVDPQRVAAQSYAQTRNNARPPPRTLNPASKVPRPASSHSCFTITFDCLFGDLFLFYDLIFKTILHFRRIFNSDVRLTRKPGLQDHVE